MQRDVVTPITTGADRRWCRAEQLAALETPCFVFDPERIIASYRKLKAALATPLIVSVKANPNPDVLARCVHEFVDGVEVASIGELNVVIGRAPGPKYIASPALDEALVLAAASCRAHIVIDSRAQAELVISLRARLRALPPLLVRVNAAALLYRGKGFKPDHFGVEPDEAVSLAAMLGEAGLKVVGLHVFAGSRSFLRTASTLAGAMRALVSRMTTVLGHPLALVNLGGGFDPDWASDPAAMTAYREGLAPLREEVNVVHESGRAIFEPGGTFVTRIVSTKALDGRWIAVCDGGMAQAFRLAETEAVIKRRRTPKVVSVATAVGRAQAPIDFVGSSCNPADIIGVAEDLPAPGAGDVVLFDDLGAYHTYTPASFLNLRQAKKYLVS